MGRLINKARIEAGFTQSELGERSYFHQASISLIEAGKREVSSLELFLLSAALSKPILYFVPEPYNRFFQALDKPPEIEELLLVARNLNATDLERLTIQARALAKHS
jgi:transcriptional regulator with XRE-family HTH domain